MKPSIQIPRRSLICALVGIGLWPLHVCAQSAPSRSSDGTAAPTRIRILIGDKTVPVTLDDNATARDFAALLPLSLTLEDYAATEKIATLPRKLSTAGAPAGTTPEVGDFSYYAPWGNLAIFHKPFRFSAGLIRLGRIDSGVEILRTEGRMTARIEVLPR
jgi:hypothetical protein